MAILTIHASGVNGVADLVGRREDGDFVARLWAAIELVGELIAAHVGSDFDARYAANPGPINAVATTAALRVAQQGLDGAEFVATDGGYSYRLRDVAPCFTLAERRVLDLARKRTWP